MGGLESQLTNQQAQITALQSKNQALVLHYTSIGSLPWIVTTVDSAGNLGEQTSLAFGPDGQSAGSYCDVTNGDLKFARTGVFPPGTVRAARL